MLAYLVCILHTSQDFGRLAWVNYDSAFCYQAATTENHQWSQVNPSLYSICFAEVTRSHVRCDLCLSLDHHSEDCTMAADADPDVDSWLRAVESAVLALAQPRWQMPSPTGPTEGASAEPCHNFNRGRCSFRWCHYRHICRICQALQPASECCEKASLQGSPPAGLPRGGHAQMAWQRRAHNVQKLY